MYRCLIGGAILCLLWGCAAQDSLESGGGVPVSADRTPGTEDTAAAGKQASSTPAYSELRSTVRFYDKRLRKPLRNFKHEELMLWIPAINGNLYGSVNGEAMVKPRLDQQLRFGIDMTLLAANVAGAAKPVIAEVLNVEPADTRIARVPAYVLDKYNGEMLGKTRWFDPAKRRELLLVYVDKACSITGTIERDGKRYEHDIQLDGPGLHWLRRSSDSKRRAKIVARTRPGKIALAVVPKPQATVARPPLATDSATPAEAAAAAAEELRLDSN